MKKGSKAVGSINGFFGDLGPSRLIYLKVPVLEYLESNCAAVV